MTNNKIKQLISELEHTLVSQQNDIQRGNYNNKFKDNIINSRDAKIKSLENSIEAIKYELIYIANELELDPQKMVFSIKELINNIKK